MRAVVAETIGPWRQSLAVRNDVERLRVCNGTVLVRVLSCGICFPDVLVVEGKHVSKKKAGHVPANEIAGCVIAVGNDVKSVEVGDYVFGMCYTGGLAEEALMMEQDVYAVPPTIDPNTVAGFETNYGTTFHSLVDLAQLVEGETLLVLGASGGVGLAAVDLGHALGARVIACASTAQKLAHCREAGADVCINYVEDGGGDFKQALKDAGEYGNIDVCFDPVGGDYTEIALRSLGFGGRLVIVGFAAGGTNPKSAIAKLPANLALLNERRIIGCLWGFWRARDGNVQNRSNIETMVGMLEAGRLRPVVSARFSFDTVLDAFEAIMSRKVIGKVVVLPSPAARL